MQNLQLPIAGDSSERQVLFGRILEKEELVDANELAARLCLDAGVVREALNYWVEQGRVEILRPYRASDEREQDLDYYRWKKDSDETFRWESELLFKCPYCRNSGDLRNINKERSRFMSAPSEAGAHQAGKAGTTKG